jgi:hypothetical protein
MARNLLGRIVEQTARRTILSMFGWMSIFLLMILGGSISAVDGSIGHTFVLTSTAVFGFLLTVSALTLLLRGRA